MKKIKNSHAQTKFTGSYKKKSVINFNHRVRLFYEISVQNIENGVLLTKAIKLGLY